MSDIEHGPWVLVVDDHGQPTMTIEHTDGCPAPRDACSCGGYVAVSELVGLREQLAVECAAKHDARQRLEGAEEALRHILESAEHPSLTVRSTEYIAGVARDALDRLADASRAIQRPEEGTDA